MNTELIARLEAAEVGSRELGRDIIVALNQVREVDEFTYYGIGTEHVWHFGEHAEDDGNYHILPDPSSSLDAAIALADKVLPEEWRYKELVDNNLRKTAHVGSRDGENSFSGVARSLPLALCIAILRALDAKTPAP